MFAATAPIFDVDVGNELAQAYLETKAGMADLTKQEVEEARRRAHQRLPWTKPAAT
jgi:hypothetical protein